MMTSESTLSTLTTVQHPNLIMIKSMLQYSKIPQTTQQHKELVKHHCTHINCLIMVLYVYWLWAVMAHTHKILHRHVMLNIWIEKHYIWVFKCLQHVLILNWSHVINQIFIIPPRVYGGSGEAYYYTGSEVGIHPDWYASLSRGYACSHTQAWFILENPSTRENLRDFISAALKFNNWLIMCLFFFLMASCKRSWWHFMNMKWICQILQHHEPCFWATLLLSDPMLWHLFVFIMKCIN